MKKILFWLLFVVSLFTYDIKELKGFLDLNSSKIDSIIKSKDAFNLLSLAIRYDRLDILKKAQKLHFDFNCTDERNDNLLMFASFLAKPKFVDFLIDKIDPNDTNKRGVNSLGMVLAGIDQNYPFVFYEKYAKETKTNADKKTFEAYKNKIEQNIIKTIDILKENSAKSEFVGNRYSTFLFIRNFSRAKKQTNKKLRDILFKYYLNDKQKIFLYFLLKEDKKGKEILKNHIEYLKDPYYLDYPVHFLYLIAKIDRLNLAKYMLNLAKQHHIDIVNYDITYEYAKNIDELYDTYWGKKFYKLYSNEIKDGNETKVFDLLSSKNYKELDNYTKDHFWNFTKNRYDIDTSLPFKEITPLFLAIIKKDKKALRILLKNGGYVSGWNALHYAILKNRPLKIDSYKKWDRVFKVNQKGLLNGITPVTLSLIYNPKYLDRLLKYTKTVDKIGFYYAIKQNLEDKVLPFVKEANLDILVSLIKKGRIDIVKELYKRGVIDKYDITDKDLNDISKSSKYYDKFIQAFKELFLEQCSHIDGQNSTICLKLGYKPDDKTLVKLLLNADKSTIKYLQKYKEYKLYGKYYPISYIKDPKYFKYFITPKSKAQKSIAECKIAIRKKSAKNNPSCKEAVKELSKIDKLVALYIALKSDNASFLKEEDIKNLSKDLQLCYYLDTNLTKAKAFYEKYKDIGVQCYLKTPKREEAFTKISQDYNQILVGAVDNNDTKEALFALKNRANPNQFSKKWGKGFPLLFVAIYNQNYKITKALIEHGVDTLYENKDKNNALLIASNSTPDILKLILKTEAKRYINKVVDMKILKVYPLSVAFFNKKFQNVDLLLKNGAKISKSDKNLFYQKIKAWREPKVEEIFKKYSIDLRK